jgi:hypothetical protein
MGLLQIFEPREGAVEILSQVEDLLGDLDDLLFLGARHRH